MDPITLILTALAMGASKGIDSKASDAVKDSYNGLKAELKRLLGSKGGEVIVDEYENKSSFWSDPLRTKLQQLDIGPESAITLQADDLLKMLDPAGSTQGRYQMEIQNAEGVQQGNQNTQTNTFKDN